MLIVPEGDSSRRRHAHTGCVIAARRAGRLPSRDEWQRSSGEVPTPIWRGATIAIRRLLGRGR
jgi:hypothetical protein